MTGNANKPRRHAARLQSDGAGGPHSIRQLSLSDLNAFPCRF
jgi:hypothetical protein